jgi:perosamine synthetase
MKELELNGVPSRAYFSPVHEQKYFRETGKYKHVNLPVTNDISERTLALPFHTKMTDEEISYVVKILIAAVSAKKLNAA